jgi:hypothetical protein
VGEYFVKWTWIGLGIGGWVFLMLAFDGRRQGSVRRLVVTLLAIGAGVAALLLPSQQSRLVETPLAILVAALLLLMLWIGAARPAASNGSLAGDSLDEDDAYAVLGLTPGASPAAVKEAHRRLMKQYHPDYGGTVEMAARINAARERILAGQAASR